MTTRISSRNIFAGCLLFIAGAASSFADPILQPPPLPGPVRGALVINDGAILKNNSAVNAEDVSVAFRIPGNFENINQGSLIFGPVGTAITNALTFGDQASNIFKTHYDFNGFVLPPNGRLDLSVQVDSKKKNAFKWNRNAMKLTDGQQHEIATLFYGGSITVERNSPLTYTFGNDSDVSVHISEIALGRASTMVDAGTFSRGFLNDLIVLNNGGNGWDLAVDEEVPLLVPFDLFGGEFLVADVLGVADMGGANELAVHFLQQHQEMPEPSMAFLVLIASAALITTTSKMRRSISSRFQN